MGQEQHFERLGIKDRDIVITAISDETFIHVGRDRDAMHAVRAGYVTHDRIGISINDHYVSTSRNIDAPGFAVDREIVPTAFATENGLLIYVIAGWAGTKRNGLNGNEGSSVVFLKFADKI